MLLVCHFLHPIPSHCLSHHLVSLAPPLHHYINDKRMSKSVLVSGRRGSSGAPVTSGPRPVVTRPEKVIKTWHNALQHMDLLICPVVAMRPTATITLTGLEPSVTVFFVFRWCMNILNTTRRNHGCEVKGHAGEMAFGRCHYRKSFANINAKSYIPMVPSGLNSWFP